MLETPDRKPTPTNPPPLSREFMDYMQNFCSIVLSDIYKLEKWEVMPLALNSNQLVLSIEAVHSEFEGARVYFTFLLTSKEVSDIIKFKTTAHLFRTGK
jgi:hypothetical protein